MEKKCEKHPKVGRSLRKEKDTGVPLSRII